MSTRWKKLMANLQQAGAHRPVASGAMPAPRDRARGDQRPAIEGFITDVRNGTLHRKPNDLHRKIALIWNETAQRSEFDLKPVKVLIPQSLSDRLVLLTSTFRKDVEKCLTWYGGSDVFAANAVRVPAPQTVRCVESICAVSCLVKAGSGRLPLGLSPILSLKTSRILRRRRERLAAARTYSARPRYALVHRPSMSEG